MFKPLVVSVLSSVLIACGGSGDDSNSNSLVSTLPKVEVTGTTSTVVVSGNADKFDLYIDSTGTNVDVQTGQSLGGVYLRGTNNMVSIRTGNTVDTLFISGVGNFVMLPPGFVVTVKDSGSSNTVGYCTEGNEPDGRGGCTSAK